MPVRTKRPSFETLGDILERLGNVSPHRVRFKPKPGTATEEERHDPTLDPRVRVAVISCYITTLPRRATATTAPAISFWSMSACTASWAF